MVEKTGTLGWLDGLSNGAATFLGSFTGAVVGLVAILLGALYNAHLNRKRDDRVRLQDATAIAIALREELQMVHKALIENAKRWREADGRATLGPDLAHLIKVFPRIIPNLGLLSADAVAAAISAYSMIEQHAETLIMLGAKPQELASGRQMYFMPPENTSHAAKMNENLAEEIQKGIDHLSKDVAN